MSEAVRTWGPAGPSLDALAADPGQAATLPADAVPGFLARTAAVQAALAARLATLGPNGHAPEDPDRLLTAAEAAAVLKVSPDYLYRHARKLPFAVRLGRHLRFSAAGIERYIRQRAGR